MADRCQYRIPVLERIACHDLFHILRLADLRIVDPLGLTVTVDHFAAAGNIVCLSLLFKPRIDLILRLAALYQIKPVSARALGVLGRHDLDPVTVLDHIINIDKLSVDSRSDHLISDSRMDRIGKVDWCGAAWKRLYISVRGKAVYTVGEHIQIALYHAQEFLIVGHVLLPFQYLTEPAELFYLAACSCLSASAFLIFPVGSDTEFCDPVHFKGSDLDLEGLSVRSDQCCMK